MTAADLHVEIKALARKIKPPLDYFGGVRIPPIELPQNILIFNRSHWSGTSAIESHPRHVLILNLETAGLVRRDQDLLPFEPGQAVLIRPYQCHQYRDLKSSQMLWLFVTFDFEHPPVWMRWMDQPVRLSDEGWSLVRQMLRHYPRKKHQDPVAAAWTLAFSVGWILMEMIQAHLPKQEAGSSNPGDLELITRVSAFIWENISKPLQLADIARSVNWSAGHLRNRFHELTGQSLGAYHRQMQIWRARQLIGTSSANMTEISGLCGFASLYSFSRAFRQATGLSPQRYKIQLRKSMVEPDASGYSTAP